MNVAVAAGALWVLWSCFASMLALVRRPHVGVRAGLIVATWFVAVVLSFI
jgi:hypothetical protein